MAAARKPVVVVTGASKGIGLAVTRILLQKFNARVVALARGATPELLELMSESKDLIFSPCDVSDETALIKSIAVAERRFDYLDALILNAGTLDPLCRIADDTPLSSWKTHFDVNFFSLITAVRAALPALRRSDLGGRIVFVSSGAAIKGTPGWGPYNASKAAMNSLCRTLGDEEPTITSVALRPGMVDTGMQEALRSAGGQHMSKEDHAKFVKVHADGALLSPEAPGYVIAALALKAPSSLTGQFVSWDDDNCKEFRAE